VLHKERQATPFHASFSLLASRFSLLASRFSLPAAHAVTLFSKSLTIKSDRANGRSLGRAWSTRFAGWMRRASHQKVRARFQGSRPREGPKRSSRARPGRGGAARFKVVRPAKGRRVFSERDTERRASWPGPGAFTTSPRTAGVVRAETLAGSVDAQPRLKTPGGWGSSAKKDRPAGPPSPRRRRLSEMKWEKGVVEHALRETLEQATSGTLRETQVGLGVDLAEA
jgi:hypothetical protein